MGDTDYPHLEKDISDMKGDVPELWRAAPMEQGNLAVDPLHTIHWRIYGHRSSQPVLFLHGGPGSGADVSHLCFFDPEKHRVLFFDQRGTGHSTPTGSLVDNTTNHLIHDIERLREMARVQSWVVFGGSWGATLGLVYAQHHPNACQALVLRGTSNSHTFQNTWVMDVRPKQLPERSAAFLSGLTAEQLHDPVSAHLDNILSGNALRESQAAYAVRALETGLTQAEAVEFSEPPPRDGHLPPINQDELARARIYLHYWVNHKFLTAENCLPNPTALDAIPVTLVHGESDWICPLAGVESLCDVLTHARLIRVSGAGHSPMHPEMTSQLRQLMQCGQG